MPKRIRAYLRDVTRMRKLAADLSSFARYASDRFLVMLLGRLPITGENEERTIRFAGGVSITYRLNRGDLQSIREVWLDEVYRLPVDDNRSVLVDLGANIGMTSIWLAKRHCFETIIAVEPVPANAEFIRRNFEINGITATVIEAAIGPRDGTARFERTSASNCGHLSSSGDEVSILSMSSLLRALSPGKAVNLLLKIDIEGAEQALLMGPDTAWLDRVKEIVIEIHPPVVDYDALVRLLKEAGFQHVPPSKMFAGSMDYFHKL